MERKENIKNVSISFQYTAQKNFRLAWDSWSGVEGKWKRKEEVEIKANSSGRVNGKKLINIMLNAMGDGDGGLCGCENVQSPTKITD